MNNLRFTFPMLWKAPALTAVAAVTLALGIGANTAVFSLIIVLLSRPMAGPRAGELVQFRSRNTVLPDTYRPFSHPDYVDLRERNQIFSHLLAYELVDVEVMEADISRRVIALPMCYLPACRAGRVDLLTALRHERRLTMRVVNY